MSILDLKLRRDIGRQKWQFVAVLVTVTLGVALFAASFNAYLNLGNSLDGSYERLAMADMTVTGAAEGFADTADAIDGVDAVEVRRQVDVPFEIDEHTFVGRLVGVPGDGQPDVNMLDLEEGAWVAAGQPDEVLLESHAAEDFELEVGDSFIVAGRSVTVAGVVVSTEYLWPARDSQNVFTAPNSFAVAFVDNVVLDAIDAPSVLDQVLVHYANGADTEAVDDTVTTAAREAGAGEIEPLAEQPSDVIIRTEIDGLRTIAVALPLLFLAAAGMAIYVVITRLVFSQRGVIGTLRASGFSRRQMARHYRRYGLIVGLVGALLGAVLGGLLGRAMTAMYTQVFGIPDLVAEVHLPTIAISLVFGLVAGYVASAAPSRTVARLAPAEAMRGDAPTEGGTQSIFERLIPPLRSAPVRWRMSLRGIGRNPKRSTSMVLGVVLGMTLILASWGMLDTMLLAIDRQFEEIALEDASAVFAEPVGEEQVARLAALDQVAVAEPVLGLSATVNGADESFGTLLEGYLADTEVHGFDPPLPAEGVLLGRAMEELLDVAEGDSVTVDLPALETSIDTTVAGFVDEPLGTAAYMQADALAGAIGAADPAITPEALTAPSLTTAKTIFADGADRDATLDTIGAVDGVAAVVDANEVRDLIDEFQAFFYLFVGMMVLFGGAMAFALIFNIISVNVAERTNEFASMRANGLTHRRVASLIVGETALLTTIGIVPGLIVGYLAAVAFMKSFSSPEFPITAELRPLSFVGATVVMFVVAGLSLIPALRAVKRINVGEVVRERAT